MCKCFLSGKRGDFFSLKIFLIKEKKTSNISATGYFIFPTKISPYFYYPTAISFASTVRAILYSIYIIQVYLMPGKLFWCKKYYFMRNAPNNLVQHKCPPKNILWGNKKCGKIRLTKGWFSPKSLNLFTEFHKPTS